MTSLLKFETERLFIRDLSLKDVGAIHDLHSRPETDRYNTLGIPESIEHTTALVAEWLIDQQSKQRSSYIFVLELKESSDFLGLIALKMGKVNYKSAEVWYKLKQMHWSKGYATEAVKRILSFAFNDLKLHRVEAGCDADNLASARVLEKAGLQSEGRKRKVLPIRGDWKDNFIYGILEEDFL